MKYQKVQATFLIPESADIKTVIGSLKELYYIDRISEAVEDDPVMFIVEEMEITGVLKEPEETLELGTGKKETLLDKML